MARHEASLSATHMQSDFLLHARVDVVRSASGDPGFVRTCYGCSGNRASAMCTEACSATDKSLGAAGLCAHPCPQSVTWVQNASCCWRLTTVYGATVCTLSYNAGLFQDCRVPCGIRIAVRQSDDLYRGDVASVIKLRCKVLVVEDLTVTPQPALSQCGTLSMLLSKECKCTSRTDVLLKHTV